MDDVGSGTGAGAGGASKSDVERLHELGYAQELKRGMSGVLELRRLVHDHLDPVGVPHAVRVRDVDRWPDQLDLRVAARRACMVTFVALAMGEVCSSYPTAGGLYYWSAKLAKRNAPAWSWFTGWFNMLGQVAVTAGIDFGFAAIFSGVPERGVRRRHHEDDPDRDLHRRVVLARPDEHVRRFGWSRSSTTSACGGTCRGARRDARSSVHRAGQAHELLVADFSWTDSRRPTVDGTAATGGFVNGTGFSSGRSDRRHRPRTSS